MDEWDVDYMDEEGPAFIELGADQMGEFRFGLTSGNIDSRITQRGGQPAAEWTWEGMDEMDPCTGRGRAFAVVGRSTYYWGRSDVLSGWQRPRGVRRPGRCPVPKRDYPSEVAPCEVVIWPIARKAKRSRRLCLENCSAIQ